MEEKKFGQEPEELDLEEEGDIVELIDEEGKSVNFRHVATIDYQNEWYVFFSPTEELDGLSEDEVVIFKLAEDEDGSDLFLPIEDEALLEAVYNEYVTIMDGEDDECGCGCEDCEGCEGCGEDDEDDGHDHDCDCGCGCKHED